MDDLIPRVEEDDSWTTSFPELKRILMDDIIPRVEEAVQMFPDAQMFLKFEYLFPFM